MENCIFENCRAEKGNLISYQNEITPGYVAIISNCRFNGCSAGENRNLIGQKVSTRNFYGKAQSYQIYTFYRERAKFMKKMSNGLVWNIAKPPSFYGMPYLMAIVIF